MSGIKETFRLIQNELIKVIRQTSWRVMAIILTVIVIGYPVLVKLMNSPDRSYVSDSEQRSAESEEGSVEKEYWLTWTEADKFFKDLGFNSDNWQYSDMFYSYANACLDVRAWELIAEEGYPHEEVSDMFYPTGLSVNWEVHNDANGYAEIKTYEFTPAVFNPDTGSYDYDYDTEEYELTPKAAKEQLAQCRKRKEHIEKLIKMPFSEYVQINFGSSVDMEELKAEYDAAKAEYENNPNLRQAYEAAKLRYEFGERYTRALNKSMSYMDTLLTGAEEKSLISVLSTFLDMYEYASSVAIGSEEEVRDSFGDYTFMSIRSSSYDEYLEVAKVKQTEYVEAQEILAYSIENNASIDYLTAYSARSALRNSLNVNMIVVMFFAIFMGAVIVSSEHSSGAVRLLLIRPRARWKILFSKLACLIICLVAMAVFTSAISLIEIVIIYGWNDLSVPCLMHSGTDIKEIAPIVYYLYRNFISILPSMLIMFFAFFMSTVTKKSVFALAVSLLGNIFGGTVSTFLYNVTRTSAQWLKATPIPYFALGDTFPDPVATCFRVYSATPQMYGITMGQGTVIMAVYSLLIIALTFVIFDRQQIKQ